MIEALFCFLVGLLGHQLERPTNVWFTDPDTNRLARYTEGGLLAFGLYAVVVWGKVPREYRFIVLACQAVVLLGMGAGVVVGYLLNGIRGEK